MNNVVKSVGHFHEPAVAVDQILRECEKCLTLAIEGSGLGCWHWHVQSGELEVDERWAQMIGYTPQELAPFKFDSWLGLIHSDDVEMSKQSIYKCVSDEIPLYECEIKMKHKNGHYIWVLARGRVVERCEDGQPLRISGTCLDVTEHKQAEDALRESEQALRTIFDNAHDAVFIHGSDGRILDVNRKMLELYGVSREQARQSSLLNDFSGPGHSIEQLEKRWKRVMAGEALVFEWIAKRPNDGTCFDVEIALKKIILENRPVVLANVRDISQRKAAEAVLKENEEKFRALVENSIDAIMRFDRQHRHLYVNAIVEKETGIPAAEFIGKTHEDLGFPRVTLRFVERCFRPGFSIRKSKPRRVPAAQGFVDRLDVDS